MVCQVENLIIDSVLDVRILLKPCIVDLVDLETVEHAWLMKEVIENPVDLLTKLTKRTIHAIYGWNPRKITIPSFNQQRVRHAKGVKTIPRHRGPFLLRPVHPRVPTLHCCFQKPLENPSCNAVIYVCHPKGVSHCSPEAGKLLYDARRRDDKMLCSKVP